MADQASNKAIKIQKKRARKGDETSGFVAQHNDILRVLRDCTPVLRGAILPHLSKNHIFALCEISDNLLCGHISLTAEEKNKLSRHKNILRFLAARAESWTKKKEAIVKSRGSFLPHLLSVVKTYL